MGFNKEDYHKERTTYCGRVKDVFGSYGLFQDAKKILDWGCSYGVTTKEIFKNVRDDCSVFGIDNMLHRIIIGEDVIKKEDRLNLVAGDGFTYFQDKGEKFDLVLAMNNILYMMNDSNRSEIMDSLGKLVDNDGRLILATDYGRFSCGYFNGGYVVLQKDNSLLKGYVRNSCKIKDKVTLYELEGNREIKCPDIYKKSKRNLDELVRKYFISQ